MNYSEILQVSDKSGLYLLHKKRTDGLIIKSLTDNTVSFASSRSHTFTPLENITIYTHNDPVELLEVFKSIKAYCVKKELPSPKSDSAVLRSFFEEVLPNYDQNKVYTSDISKIIKMYKTLEPLNIIESTESKNDKGKHNQESTSEEVSRSKPAKSAKNKKEPKIEEKATEVNEKEKTKPSQSKTTKKTSNTNKDSK